MGSFPVCTQRRQETVQHLSLSSALDDVIARWRNLCHQLMGIFVGVSRKSPASAHRSAAFVVVLAPLNWLVDNYSGLADCLSSGNLVASLLVALDDCERNSNGTDGVGEPRDAQCVRRGRRG